MKKIINDFGSFKSNGPMNESKIASEFLEKVYETGSISNEAYQKAKNDLSTIEIVGKDEINVKRTVLNEIYKSGNISVDKYGVILKREGI